MHMWMRSGQPKCRACKGESGWDILHPSCTAGWRYLWSIGSCAHHELGLQVLGAALWMQMIPCREAWFSEGGKVAVYPVTLAQWFWSMFPGAAAPGNWSEMQVLQPYPRPTDSETLGWVPATCMTWTPQGIPLFTQVCKRTWSSSTERRPLSQCMLPPCDCPPWWQNCPRPS